MVDKEMVSLAYEHSQKGLAQQEARLDAMRQHAGTLGAISALGAGLFGALAFETMSAIWICRIPELAAISFLLLTVGSIVKTLWADKGYVFHISVEKLLDQAEGMDFPTVQLKLAIACEGYWKSNDAILTNKQHYLQAGYVLLILQFFSWAVAILW